jgi:hypothetical protein
MKVLSDKSLQLKPGEKPFIEGNTTKTNKIDKIQNLVLSAVLGGALFSIHPAEGQQVFYSADFSSPLNQVGQPPATGYGSLTPSSIVFGTPTVESSFGSLTNQPLVFSAVGYQQIQFDLGRGVPSYFVDFDFETHNLNPSLFSFVLLCDTPEVQNFDLHGWGFIQAPNANLPGWSDDQLHHMRIDIDLADSSWALALDGGAPATGLFSSQSGDILSMRMNLSTWRAGTPDDPSVQVGIDNVVVGTAVPEPASANLFCIAGCLLLIRKWHRTRVGNRWSKVT